MTDPASGKAPLDRNQAAAIVDVLTLSENLKTEMRHSWLSDGRQESVAEHSWLMAFAAVLIAPHLQHPVDLGHTLKLIAVHDIAEVITGDIPYFETSARKDNKLADETDAMDRIRSMLPEESGTLLLALWQEYEDGETPEAKFARALDKLEVQHQHNLADLRTWTEREFGLVYSKMDKECAHDAALMALLAVIRARAEAKMAKGGVDIAAVKTGAD